VPEESHPLREFEIMPDFDRRHFLAAATSTALASSVMAADDPKAKIAPTSPNKPTPPFKLGTVTYMVAAKWDLATLLKVCKNAGIAAVECRTTHAHGVEPTLTAEQRKEVKKRFEDSGVVFWGCGSTCEFHSPDAKVVEKQIDLCKQFVELVADLGGKGVKVRPNDLPKEIEPAKTIEQIGKSMDLCGKFAEKAGVEIICEVHGKLTQNPDNMASIMKHVDSKSVGVAWNSNPTDIKNGSVKEGFELLKPWIRHCHINDLYNDLNGKYPYRELFALLTSINYQGYTMCEVGRSPADAAAGEEFLRYYKALWTELALPR
jgi:sugar phosphate isomerase/epimerase